MVWLLVGTNVALLGYLLLACVKIEHLQADLTASEEKHEACHTKTLALLGNLNKKRDGATALRMAADKWDDPTNKPLLDRMAREKYEPGGPSMPAIFLREEAATMSEVSGNDLTAVEEHR